MTPIRDFMHSRLSLLAVLGLTLAWGASLATKALAEDDHAGHEHAIHAETEEHDDHTDAEHDESVADAHGDEDDHAGHDHASHAEEEEHDDHAEAEHDESAADVHGDEDEHAGHDHAAQGEQEDRLRLTTEQLKRFGITVETASAGDLHNEVSLPGEIVFNEDRVVHLVPRVAGIARDVRKKVGDRVQVGEILAVIESRELADAKSEYLAARARGSLAEKNFERERALRAKQVSSEQDYLQSEQTLAEARIAHRSAEQKLHALGLSESVVEALEAGHGEAITRYEIRSPIAGVVTTKHISLGESLAADDDIFTVVDMSSVWVNLTIHTKHLDAVRPHQEVILRVDHSGAQARGVIEMVTPFVEESTRSATARVILDNSDGRWMPGTFVTGFSRTSDANLAIVVSRDSVQNIEGRDVVFVEHEDGFEMTPVAVGRSDRDRVEVTAGLAAGTRYVAQGAFQLKATVITSNLGSHAGHGH